MTSMNAWNAVGLFFKQILAMAAVPLALGLAIALKPAETPDESEPVLNPLTAVATPAVEQVIAPRPELSSTNKSASGATSDVCRKPEDKPAAGKPVVHPLFTQPMNSSLRSDSVT